MYNTTVSNGVQQKKLAIGEKFVTKHIVGQITPESYIGTINKMIINVPVLPLLDPSKLSHQIYIIKSGCNTQKSVRLINPIKHWIDFGFVVVVITPFQSLTRNKAEQYQLVCYEDLNGQIKESCAVCLDSTHRIIPGDKKYILIFDEAARIARSSLGSTLRKSETVLKVNNHIKKLVVSAQYIIFQDAHINDAIIRHIFFWCSEIKNVVNKTVFIENINHDNAPTIKARWDIKLRKFTDDQKQENKDKLIQLKCANKIKEYKAEKLRQKELRDFRKERERPIAMFAHHNQILECLKTEQNKPWIFCNSSNFAESYHRFLTKEFPKKRFLLCMSNTMGCQEVKECFENPDLFKNYDGVFITPCGQTGLSINDKNVWETFLFVKNYLDSGYAPTVHDVFQAGWRIRNPINNTWNVFIYGNHEPRSTNVRELYDNFKFQMEERKKNIKELLKEVGKQFPEDDNYFWRLADLDAEDNRYSQTFKDSDWNSDIGTIHKQANDEGMKFENVNEEDHSNLTLSAGYKAFSEELEEHKEKLIEEKDQRVLLAKEITPRESFVLEKNPKTPEIVAQITRNSIKEFVLKNTTEEITLELIQDCRIEGLHKVRHLIELGLQMEGKGNIITKIDENNTNDTSLHSKNIPIKIKMKEEIWNDYGIFDIQDYKTVIKNPAPYSDEKFEKIYKILGIKCPTKNMAMLLRSLSQSSNIKLEGHPYKDENNKVKRYYTIDNRIENERGEKNNNTVSRKVELGKCYKEKLLSPDAILTNEERELKHSTFRMNLIHESDFQEIDW